MSCEVCNGSHFVYKCVQLLKLSVNDRIEKVKHLHLCLNCLRSNHTFAKCLSQGCRECKAKHNTLLCKNKQGNTHSDNGHPISSNASIEDDVAGETPFSAAPCSTRPFAGSFVYSIGLY